MDPITAMLLGGAVVGGACAYLFSIQRKVNNFRQEASQNPYPELDRYRRSAALLDSLPDKPITPSPTKAQKNALRKVNEAKEKARNHIDQHKKSTQNALHDLWEDEKAQTQRLAELDQLEATVSQAKSKLNTILKKL